MNIEQRFFSSEPQRVERKLKHYVLEDLGHVYRIFLEHKGESSKTNGTDEPLSL